MNATSITETAAAAANRIEGQDLSGLLAQLAKPEVQQSLTMLIDHLPRWMELADKLTETCETIRALASDPVFVADVKGGFNEMVVPAAGKAKDFTSALMEASERAQAETDTIGLFGVLRMMNDPQAQKLFRFIRAFMAVTNEREHAR